jgi:hypothetical protein
MEFLVTNGQQVLVIEAPTDMAAMEAVAPTLLVSAWDKKYGNMISVPKPTTPDEWRELERKLCVSTGEYLEHFGHPNHLSVRLREYARDQITPASAGV